MTAHPDAAATGIDTVTGACPHDCPDRCVWTVEVRDGVAVELAGSREHPGTAGRLCAKVDTYLADRVYRADRLTTALRRTGAKGAAEFEPVALDDALDDIAGRLAALVRRHGGETVLPFNFEGTQGLVQNRSMDRRFFARLGATRLERTICGAAAAAGVTAVNGTTKGVVPQDVAHSRFVVLWGTNTIVTNQHLWPYVRRAREAGARVVVVDPARTRTARAADWHVRPRPGTDAALALGLAHVICAEGLWDRDYVTRHTHGFDAFRERALRYPPERVEELTGVDAAEVVALAREFAASQPSLVRVLVGMEHSAGGGGAYRAVACLPALVGAWRRRGGGLTLNTTPWFTEALAMRALERDDLRPRPPRTVNMVQLGRALAPGALDPPIHALFVYCANPAVAAPNQPLVQQGLRREDLFTVVHDTGVTPTAAYADYVLPATTQVEHLDLMASWGHVDLVLNRPAVSPPGDCLSNTELYRRLATRLGFDEPCFADSDERIVRQALDSDHPRLEGITYEHLLEHGWARLRLPADHRPFACGGFPTPTGRAELWSTALEAQGLDPLPHHTAEPGRGGYPLQLQTAKALHFLNSTYADVDRHRRAEGPPTVLLHPDDAGPRGIADGTPVTVSNERGALRMTARVVDDTPPGTAFTTFGAWAAKPGGPTVNALTTDALTDLGGGGAFGSTFVEVAPG